MLTHAVRKQFKFTMAEQAWMKLEGERDSPQPISHSLKTQKCHEAARLPSTSSSRSTSAQAAVPRSMV